MPEALEDVAESPRYAFAKADICDGPALRRVFAEQRPDAVMHLAAESHVDRSIDDAADFMQTNVVGTFRLLEPATAWCHAREGGGRGDFRLHPVSPHEVYGLPGSAGAATAI